MNSYSSPIPFKHVHKVSEEDLKTILKSRVGIFSNVVRINEFPEIKCRIDLHLETESDENGEEKEMIWVYLLNPDDGIEIYSNFAFYIESANFLEYVSHLYLIEDGFDNSGDFVCSLADFFDPEKKYIVGGKFVVKMNGFIMFKKTEKKIEMPENSVIERLWNDDDGKDFVIAVGKDNEHKVEIKVHKCIFLSACSPVFKTMFKTDMKEMQEGKVEIIDFDSDSVKLAVAFCYEQNIFEDYLEWEQLISLHHFADKYDIEDLKDQTEAYMVEKLSLEDICKITNALIKLNAPKLRDFCFRFLLMAVKEGIPVKDMDILDKDFGMDLLKKVTSVKNC